ncbi:MAG: cytochrome C biogenesis protein [Rhizobiales bacterium NRL2]|nr:MAG: cytochrome C biogenesis protein [Rhizobiales bacterium NRL2]
MTAELSLVGLVVTFLAGAISFLSPCVLPLVPGYVSYIAGGTARISASPGPRRFPFAAVALSLFFVLGFSTVFIILGASATALGQLMLGYRYELNIVGGTVVIVFGLFMLGFARFGVMQRDLRIHLSIPGGRPVAAYVLGLAFAFGWTPCIGPILGAILTTTAASATVSEGTTLLAVYSAGLGVPFLLAAAFTERLARRLRPIGHLGRRLHQVAGVILIVMGVAMITDYLSAFAFWLLDTFPILGQIG